MPRGNRRTPTPEERMRRWQGFLDACDAAEREKALELLADLRAGVHDHYTSLGIKPYFGADMAVELLVALVDWSQYYHRTCRVRKGVQKQ